MERGLGWRVDHIWATEPLARKSIVTDKNPQAYRLLANGYAKHGATYREIIDHYYRNTTIGSVGGGGRYDGLVSRFRGGHAQVSVLGSTLFGGAADTHAAATRALDRLER